MNKYLIALCGGSGKTTICTKFPNFFLDIDDFMWNFDNQTRKNDLLAYEENDDIDNIINLYRNEMQNNPLLRNDPRIILGHHPNNAKDLDRICLDVIRPNNKLHLQSIKDRTARLKRHNIYGWNDLTLHNPHQFDDYNELETILLNHLHSVKLKDAEAS